MSMSNNGDRIDKQEIDKIINKENKEKQPKKRNVKRLVHFCIVATIAVAYAVILAFGKLFIPADNEFYISFNIFNGDNDPMHYARLLSYAILVYCAGTLLRFIIQLLSEAKIVGKKVGVAVMKMFGNLIKYVVFIILACLLLNAFGVDTVGIIAGLGIIALIIGLGMTSLIEDVVAGAFFVGERSFDIGDIVVINNFRGTVISMGIRTIQIEDEGGNIMAVRNSKVGSLINMTNHASYAIVEMAIAGKEDVDKVKNLVESSLDSIKINIPDIVNGPFYIGIERVSAASFTLMFVAACPETAKYKVQRQMNYELKVLFDKNGISLA